ncbi:MAG TPA: transglutaminase domain-containing protein, partial [Candidatus Paceibacterota bacterium]|nr:transglutaminase domain-containing protein [Candidatus Paceibacterota bacterium]
DDGRTDNRTRIALPAFQPERLLIRQQIRTKPLGDLCFCLAQPLRVNLSKVRVFDGDVLLFPYVNHMDREYEVDSELSPPSDHPALATAPEVDRIPRLERYLRVPTSMAKKLGNWGPRPAAGQTPWARAEQIRLHLVNELSYSLAPFMPPEEMDPLEFFLLRKKTGYCTHFASAMALLARMNGLPARVVTGFCYSGPPESDGVFIVRDHHAHAWTEIFFQNHGWIVFDATPPACMPPFTGFEETQGLGLLLSWFMRFNDYLSEFDTSLQADFLKSLLLLPVRAALWIFTTPFLWAMLLGCALIWRFLIPRLPPMKQRRIRRFFSRRRFSTHVEFYDDLLWLLAKTGCRKSPSDTGLEFVQRLAGQWPDRELSWLTHQYYAIRFGGKRLSPEDSVETERCLQVVEQWIAKHNGSLAKSAPLFKQSAPANW